MTKIQQREVNQARMAASMGRRDMAARILSAMIRSAMRDSDKLELHRVARELRVTGHDDYICEYQDQPITWLPI